MGKGEDISQVQVLREVTRALPKAEYEVTHAYLQQGDASQAGTSPAEKAKEFRFSRRQLGGFRRQALAEVARFCQEGRFHVAIGHGYRPAALLLAVNRRRPFRLCIGATHRADRYSLRRRLATRLAMRDNCRFVGVSEEVTHYLLGLGAGFTPANTRTIGNAIDIEALRKAALSRREARAQLQLPARGFVFGALGRFAPVKAHRTLIEAFHRVSAESPGACLALIGSGALEADYRQRIAQLELGGCVFLLGEVPEASRVLRAFDVFVLPSLREGLSIALMEAMAASLPIIGSDARGVQQVIAGVGEVFPRGKAAALAEAMRRHLAMSQQELDSIGARTLAQLRQRHSLAAFRRDWRQLIDSWRSP